MDNIYGFGHTPLYSDFLNSIKTGQEPLINGIEGQKALEIILHAYKAAFQKQVVVFGDNEIDMGI